VIHFTVMGEPVPKGRHRSRIAQRKYTGPLCEHCNHPLEPVDRFIQQYTPPKTVKYENAVKAVAQTQITEMVEGPARIFVRIFKARPGKLKAKRHPDGPVKADTNRSDSDNYLKAIMDALNGLAYSDDRLISKAGVEVYYCGRQGKPRAEVWVAKWED